jgi:hypothetical protein
MTQTRDFIGPVRVTHADNTTGFATLAYEGCDPAAIAAAIAAGHAAGQTVYRSGWQDEPRQYAVELA